MTRRRPLGRHPGIALMAVSAAWAASGAAGAGAAPGLSPRWSANQLVAPAGTGDQRLFNLDDLLVAPDGSGAVLWRRWEKHGPTYLRRFDARGRLGKLERVPVSVPSHAAIDASGAIAIASTWSKPFVVISSDGWRRRALPGGGSGQVLVPAPGGRGFTWATLTASTSDGLVRCEVPRRGRPSCAPDLALPAGESLMDDEAPVQRGDGATLLALDTGAEAAPADAVVIAGPDRQVQSLPLVPPPADPAAASIDAAGDQLAVAGVSVRHYGDAGPRGGLWYAVGSAKAGLGAVHVVPDPDPHPHSMSPVIVAVPSGGAVLGWIVKDPTDGFALWGKARWARIDASGAITATGLLDGTATADSTHGRPAWRLSLQRAGGDTVLADWTLLSRGPCCFEPAGASLITADRATPVVEPSGARRTITNQLTPSAGMLVRAQGALAVRALVTRDARIVLQRARLPAG